jgi:hypothetical protein
MHRVTMRHTSQRENTLHSSLGHRKMPTGCLSEWEHVSQALLNEYNLGIDPEERTRRMVEATARRVGFQLPPQVTEVGKGSNTS